MNTLLIIVVVVALCYFGGAKCPKVLKDNKEMLLGVLVGLALCSFMGVRLEGYFNNKEDCAAACGTNDSDMRRICNSPYFRGVDEDCYIRDKQGLIIDLARGSQREGESERERFASTYPPSDDSHRDVGGRGSERH
tara:strand:+ start:469 stop:876 length:408 start_codon:yes stop_codon:yes gene_type:complete